MQIVQTKVSYVREGSKSLKAVIPEAVVSVLKLQHGDSLDWEIEAEAAGKFRITVRKAK
ncbi:MAG: AbrB/MazE/SpoVT family DNA-binding domain-containing protein [Nitrososphaerales archaeon]